MRADKAASGSKISVNVEAVKGLLTSLSMLPDELRRLREGVDKIKMSM